MTRISVQVAFVFSLVALLTRVEAQQQFAPIEWSLPSLREATDVSSGDIDGDGDEDLLILRPERAHLFRNEGGMRFADSTAAVAPALLALSSRPTQARALDLEGDGDLDFLIAQGSSGQGGAQNLLLLNDGAGIFIESWTSRFPAALDDSMGLESGDVDGDGDLDVLFANEGGSTSVLYLQGPTGAFTPAPASRFPLVRGPAKLVDADNDGDLDLTLLDPFLAFFTNDGQGTFTGPVTLFVPGSMNDAVFGDLDQDGDQDILTYEGRVLENQGGLVSCDITVGMIPLALLPSRAAALGDVDGDGVLNILLGRDDLEDVVLTPLPGPGPLYRPTPISPRLDRTLGFHRVDLDGN